MTPSLKPFSGPSHTSGCDRPSAASRAARWTSPGVGRWAATMVSLRSAARSAMATNAFREAGFEAYNLDGGLLAWVESGLSIEPEDGRVAGH